MRSEYQVRTPESVEFSYELAGLGSRMLATVVDYLVIAALGVLCWVAAIAIVLFSGGVLAGVGLAAGIVGVFLLWYGYFTWTEWRWNGQTVGKRLLDLRVIDERGFAIDLFQSVIRNLLRVVDMMPFFYGVGGVAALSNPRQKRLGDSAAGTVVVKLRRRLIPGAVLAQGERYNSLQDDAALRIRIRGTLGLEERDALLQLCIRRHELDLEARQALFEEAAAFLEGRLGIRREPFMSPEKFVQNIAAIALAESAPRPPRGAARRLPTR